MPRFLPTSQDTIWTAFQSASSYLPCLFPSVSSDSLRDLTCSVRQQIRTTTSSPNVISQAFPQTNSWKGFPCSCMCTAGCMTRGSWSCSWRLHIFILISQSNTQLRLMCMLLVCQNGWYIFPSWEMEQDCDMKLKKWERDGFNSPLITLRCDQIKW